ASGSRQIASPRLLVWWWMLRAVCRAISGTFRTGDQMSSGIIFVGDRPKIAVAWQGEGDLVLFLHGVGGNRTNWEDQVEEVSHTHRAVAWDLRGYGLSDDVDS